MSLAQSLRAVVLKDLRSEIRTRYGITAVALFVVTSVALVAFATADEQLHRPVAAGVLWVVMFFTAMSGLGRGFISEAERGTALYLQLSAPSTAVILGKLISNTIIAAISNLAVLALFVVFIGTIQIASPWILFLVLLVGSIGLATVITITSAIVATAGTRSPLLPVLSFPVLIPLIMPGMNATLLAMADVGMADVWPDVALMLSHSGIVATMSYLVFEVVWTE
jgi:heme exporter protein B